MSVKPFGFLISQSPCLLIDHRSRAKRPYPYSSIGNTPIFDNLYDTKTVSQFQRLKHPFAYFFQTGFNGFPGLKQKAPILLSCFVPKGLGYFFLEESSKPLRYASGCSIVEVSELQGYRENKIRGKYVHEQYFERRSHDQS